MVSVEETAGIADPFSNACSLQLVIKEFNFLSFLILSINDVVTSADLISFFFLNNP